VHLKGTITRVEEIVYIIGKNLYQLSSHRKLISRIYKELKKLATKRSNNPIKSVMY
jgi:hypothetical protein